MKSILSPRAHSVRDRLNDFAKAHVLPTELLFTRYAQERFLYRLSCSEYQDQLMLKGGLLFTAITDRFGRATRDIDLLASAGNSIAAYAECIRTITDTAVDDDGVTFACSSIRVDRIMLQDDESGLRALFTANLGGARIRMQVDAGYDDDVFLGQERFSFPILLEDVPEVVIRAYSTESILAEKFEAITSLGETSTRYKDYDDVVQLARLKQFRSSAVYAAVNLTYTKRGTDFKTTMDAIRDTRATPQREKQWQSYAAKSHARNALPSLAASLAVLRDFWIGIEAYTKDGVDREWAGSWTPIR